MGATQQVQEFRCCEFSFNQENYFAENKELAKKELLLQMHKEWLRTGVKSSSGIFMFKTGLK